MQIQNSHVQKQQSKSSKFDLRSNIARNSAEKCTSLLAFHASDFFSLFCCVLCLPCIHLKLRMLISNSNFPINLSCPFCKEPSSNARCTDPSYVLFFEVTTQSNVLYMTYERIDFSSFFQKKRAQTRLHQIKISDCVLRVYFHLHSLSRYFFHISTKQFSKYCQEH